MPASHAPLRVFLGAFGQPGHAFPMLALGERLVQRGHEVTFETWERWRGFVQSAGMRFVPAPESSAQAAHAGRLSPYDAAARATAATRAALRCARAEVVVSDVLTLAPAFAAELEGVLSATLIPHLYPVAAPGFAPFASGARLPRTAAGRLCWGALAAPLSRGLELGRLELNRARRSVGLAPVRELHGGLSRSLRLVATFPALEYPRRWPQNTHVVGPLLWEPPGPRCEPPPGDAPLILVAPSTSHDPSHRLVRSALAGLRGLDVRVLATLDRRPLAAVGAGGGARLVNWMSYEQTMGSAALVVCHGGHGTVARALERGVPVLAVPHSGDMAENAARLDWAGLGVRLPWRLLCAATLRLAVERALDRLPELTANAAQTAAWARANDGATRAAELIEELAASR